MTKHTKIIYPDGKILHLDWKDGTRPNYEWLREAVGGFIESVDRFMENGGPFGRIQAYCNEEGRLLNLPCNILGMKTINWPPPPCGWENLPEYWEDNSHMIVFIHSNMSEEECAKAEAEMERWSPVVGPILIMYGWIEEEYDDDEGVHPGTLGNEMCVLPLHKNMMES